MTLAFAIMVGLELNDGDMADRHLCYMIAMHVMAMEATG